MRWILIVIMVLFIGCKKHDKVEELQSQIDKLKFQINTLKDEKSEINNSVDLKDIKEKIEKLNNKILDNKMQISKIEKNIKDLNSSIVHIPFSKINCKGYFKPTTFITTKKTKIYNSKGDVVAEWDKCTTFTSYFEKDGKLRITGIFVHLKWQDARSKDWWINIKDVAKKFKDKHES